MITIAITITLIINTIDYAYILSNHDYSHGSNVYHTNVDEMLQFYSLSYIFNTDITK